MLCTQRGQHLSGCERAGLMSSSRAAQGNTGDTKKHQLQKRKDRQVQLNDYGTGLTCISSELTMAWPSDRKAST